MGKNAPFYPQILGQRFGAIEAQGGSELVQVLGVMKELCKLVLAAL